jgi:hypothetical protein
MEDGDRLVLKRSAVLFPRNSGILPDSGATERQFMGIIAQQTQYFYKHTASADYALDSVANH